MTAILDADFPLGPITEAFPDAPAAALLAEKQRYRGVYTPDDEWRLRVRGWLVRHPGGTLLLDTGIGGASSPTQSWAPTEGMLPDGLAEVDVAPHHIDTVAISHVHDDHIGGVLDEGGAPRYPNARYLVQRADIDWQRDLGRENEEDAAIWALLAGLDDAGVLVTIEGDHEVAPHLTLHLLPGHTPGHQILRIVADGRRMLLSADTWNHPSQFAHPDWPSGPDANHGGAAAARRRLLAEILSHPGTVVAPTHLAESFGTVRSGPDGLAMWVPLEEG